MIMIMGVIPLPSVYDYWSRCFQILAIADVMPRNRFLELRRYLHFVDNTATHDSDDKLFKIRPVVEAVRNECVKVTPEEYHSVDKQIIPSKTKYTKIKQYNPKKSKKREFKNLVPAGSSGFMYDFLLYAGKTEASVYHLHKRAQVVARLCEHLQGNIGHRLFFENLFTTIDLLIYLKEMRVLVVGTVRANRLQGCPLELNKTIKK